MKFALCLACLFAAVAGLTQYKIKTEVTAAGDTILSTPDKKIYAAPGPKNAVGELVKSTAYKFSTGFSLCLQLQTGRTSVFTVGHGDAATFFLTDGSTVALRPRGENSSRRSALDYGCYVFVFYPLNAGAWQKLRSTSVEKIVVQASLGTMTYELKDKQGDVIRQQLLSFTENGPQ